MPRTIAIAFALLFAAAVSQPAAAAPSGDKKLAKKLFEKGELHYQQGDFVKALAAYKKAHATYRHTAFIFNIAQCHRQLKQYTKALFFYRLFLSERPNAPNRVEVRRRIKQMEAEVKKLAALSKQVGRVSLISQPEGATVRVDKFSGSPAGTTPVILKLSAGEHLVLFEKPGYEKMHKTVTVRSGKIAMLTVTLKPVVTPRRVEPRRTDPRRTEPRPGVTPDPGTAPAPGKPKPVWKRWWLWTGVGVAVVAMGLGAVAGGLALKEYDRYKRDGEPGYWDDAKQTALVADILLFGGAAVGVATAVAAILVHLRDKKASRERAKALNITPTCGPGGCGVLVRGRF